MTVLEILNCVYKKARRRMKMFVVSLLLFWIASICLISCAEDGSDGENKKSEPGANVTECTSPEDSDEYDDCLSSCNRSAGSLDYVCDMYINDPEQLYDCWYAVSYQSSVCFEYCTYLPCGHSHSRDNDVDEGYQCWLPDNPAWECATECQANFHKYKVDCAELYGWDSLEYEECFAPYRDDYCNCWYPCLNLPCSSGRLPTECRADGAP